MIFHQISLSLIQQSPSTPPPSPPLPPTQSIALPVTRLSPDPALTASNKFLQSPSNPLWIWEQQRKVFLRYLTRWSYDHDSSPYFHGNISIAPQAAQSGEDIELGSSVSCVLSDFAFTNLRRPIIIRLFPTVKDSMYTGKGLGGEEKENSMNMFGARLIDIGHQGEDPESSERPLNPESQLRKHSSVANGYYTLVVRCGSGWVSAREYFNKLHFSTLHSQKNKRPPTSLNRSLDEVPAGESKTLGTPSQPEDTVSIQPLFHPFTRLPPELQELILFTATSLFGTYNMCHDTHLFPQPGTCSAQPSTYTLHPQQSCISLSTLFLISPHLNRTLVPYVFAATNFHFGLTGFTNFLWQAGPHNRSLVRRLTFHFGKSALLHCMRWLAPDHVFELFAPPVVTTPRSLQYFWRCQIQDLAREVRLLTLTIDVRGMPSQDLGMVTRMLKEVFGSVERVLFVETESNGRIRVLGEEDERVRMAREGASWRDMCRGYFERYNRSHYLMKFDLVGMEGAVLEERMDGRGEFDV